MEEHLLAQVGTYGVVVKNKKILLLELSKKPMWTFPGGRVNKTDLTLHDALKREICEEIGLNCNIVKILDSTLFTNSKNVKKCCIIFECELDEGEIILSEEHKKYGYFNYNEIEGFFLEDKFEKVGFDIIQTIKQLELIN